MSQVLPQQLPQPNSSEIKARKYTDILTTLTSTGRCKIACSLADALTITAGVKKEKVKWNKAKKWPKGMALKIDIIDASNDQGIVFRMVEDTSINNL